MASLPPLSGAGKTTHGLGVRATHVAGGHANPEAPLLYGFVALVALAVVAILYRRTWPAVPTVMLALLAFEAPNLPSTFLWKVLLAAAAIVLAFWIIWAEREREKADKKALADLANGVAGNFDAKYGHLLIPPTPNDLPGLTFAAATLVERLIAYVGNQHWRRMTQQIAELGEPPRNGYTGTARARSQAITDTLEREAAETFARDYKKQAIEIAAGLSNFGASLPQIDALMGDGHPVGLAEIEDVWQAIDLMAQQAIKANLTSKK